MILKEQASGIALQNPEDYEARSNIMWTATWALNTLIAKGKATDWMVRWDSLQAPIRMRLTE